MPRSKPIFPSVHAPYVHFSNHTNVKLADFRRDLTKYTSDIDSDPEEYDPAESETRQNSQEEQEMENLADKEESDKELENILDFRIQQIWFRQFGRETVT